MALGRHWLCLQATISSCQTHQSLLLFIDHASKAHQASVVCSNGRLIGPLLDAADDMKPGTARLLRLLCRPLFHARMYTQRVRIARGAYAEVRTFQTNQALAMFTGVLCICSCRPGSDHSAASNVHV